MTEPLEPSANSSPAKLSRLPIIIVLIAVCLVFGRLVGADFTEWDDSKFLTRNPDFNPPTANSVLSYWKKAGDESHMQIYYPMTATIMGLIAKASFLETPDPSGIRLNPANFHAANILFHLIASLAVLAILWKLLRHETAALFGTLFYALHPVMVEPVAWVSGIKDVLAGMFGLLSAAMYLQYRDDRKIASYAIASVLFICAILSKSTAIMVLPGIILLDLLILKTDWRQSLKMLGPWLVPAIIIGWIAHQSQPVYHTHMAPLAYRPLVMGDSLAFYFGKILFPLSLAVDYTRRPDWVIQYKTIWFYWLIPAALLVVAWIVRRRSIVPLVGMLWMMLLLAPVLGLARFEFQYYSTVADHYLYVALLGIALIVAWAVKTWSDSGAKVVAGVVIGLLALRSVAAGAVWQNNESLFARCFSVSPNSPAAMMNLGVNAAKRKEFPKAIELMKRCHEINPDNDGALQNLAIFYMQMGDVKESINWSRKTIVQHNELPPGRRMAATPGKLWLADQFLEKYGRLEIATSFVRAAQDVDPNDPEVKRHARKIVALHKAATQPSTRPATAPAER